VLSKTTMIARHRAFQTSWHVIESVNDLKRLGRSFVGVQASRPRFCHAAINRQFLEYQDFHRGNGNAFMREHNRRDFSSSSSSKQGFGGDHSAKNNDVDILPSGKSTSMNASAEAVASAAASAERNANQIKHVIQSNNAVSLARTKRRQKRNFSPLNQITLVHPKNTSIPLPPQNHLGHKLTRKQILHLTPKQQYQLKKLRKEQYLQNQSFASRKLNEVRSNVRSNIQYIGSTIDTNFKKNVKTIQRIFKGEKVWEEEAEPSQNHRKKGKDPDELDLSNIDLERIPSELKSNLKSNISSIQNFLHKATSGMIPSSAYVNDPNNLEMGGSLHTRLQKFHEVKTAESANLVMDTKWFVYNILLALLPGTLIALVCLSVEDEMKAFFAEMERIEREKVLGIQADFGEEVAGEKHVGDDGKNIVDGSVDGANNNGRMGISSALIMEGGSVIDKLKMAINDLFLGGRNEQHPQEDEPIQLHLDPKEVGSPNESPNDDSRGTSKVSSPETTTKQTGTEQGKITNSNDRDEVNIAMLLERIQSLEKKLGQAPRSNYHNSTVANTNITLTEKEKREEKRRKHEMEYEIQRLKQSPIQNRRDGELRTRWLNQMEEERKKKQEESDESKDSDSVWSLSFENFAKGIQVLVQSDLKHLRESAKEAINSVSARVWGGRVFDITGDSIGGNEYESNAEEFQMKMKDSPKPNEKGRTKGTPGFNAVVEHQTSAIDRNSLRKPVKTEPNSEEQVLEAEARDSDSRSIWNPRSWWR